MPDFQPDVSVFRNLQGTVKAETPEDWQQQAARAQAAQALAQEQRAKAQKAAEERAAEARVRELARLHGGDPDKILVALEQENPTLANTFREQLAKGRDENFKALKSQNDYEQALFRQDLAKLEAVSSDPVAYAALRPELLKRYPDMAPLLPEQHNPVAIGNALKAGVDVDKIYAQRNQSIQWGVEGKWHQAIAMALDDPEIDTPEEWDTSLQGMRTQGAPPHILAQFGTFSPENKARVRDLGRTPEQRADAAAKAGEHADTVAHQQATEANAAAQLDVSRGNLAVAQQNARRLAAQPAGGGGAAGTTAKAGGRGVTSGDANRIAEFDTSLDDLGEVRTTLTGPGSTGAVSQAGAWVPNVITEMTGWGAGAKQRQAVIDRVKQVIGKALEGGVLRKEDEYKYEKILPTISDAPAIVKSKLDGLEAAITKRRSTLIDSLGDAGYNVSAYEQRTTTRATGGSTTRRMVFDPKTGSLVEKK